MRTLIVFFLLAVAANVSNAQWVQTNGPGGGYIQSLAFSGDTLFAGTYQGGVFLSTNNGTSWTDVSSGLPRDEYGRCPIVTSFAVIDTNLFAGTGGGVFLSTNGGSIWNAVNGAVAGASCLAVSETKLFAGTDYDGVFLSTNNGTSWTEIDSGLTNTMVSSLAACGTNLFAGTYHGVFLSTNNGTSWTDVSSGLTSCEVLALAVCGTELFAGTAVGGYSCNPIGGVWRSTDNGTNWTEASSGLTDRHIFSLAVSEPNLFVGTLGGVFLSTNSGTSWTQTNTSLADTCILSLATSPTNLFAGTNQSGVWKRPLSEMITVVPPPSNELPHEFALAQNYPNPFNPVTNFQFSIANSQLTILKVYDVLGREVTTLANEVKQPGTYKVKWDAPRQASGVYFYQLSAGSFVDVKKLLLLK